jgi:hypothetical protein
MSLFVRFNDGCVAAVDLRSLFTDPIFKTLLDPKIFSRFTVDPECKTICWPNGADLSPEVVRALLPTEQEIIGYKVYLGAHRVRQIDAASNLRSSSFTSVQYAYLTLCDVIMVLGQQLKAANVVIGIGATSLRILLQRLACGSARGVSS